MGSFETRGPELHMPVSTRIYIPGPRVPGSKYFMGAQKLVHWSVPVDFKVVALSSNRYLDTFLGLILSNIIDIEKFAISWHIGVSSTRNKTNRPL